MPSNNVDDVIMRVAIIPSSVRIRVIVNPAGEVIPEPPPALVVPWVYALGEGIIETEMEGETLRELLTELSKRYREADVDFNPIDPRTNDVDFDFDIYVNGRRYEGLPNALDAKLEDGDEVEISMLFRWDG